MDYLSLQEIRRRLGLETTEEFLWSLTPQQRNALCEVRSRARRQANFPAIPLLRVHDVEAWAASKW